MRPAPTPLLALAVLAVAVPAAAGPPPVGRFHAVLRPAEGVEVPFGLEVRSSGKGLAAWLVNGSSRAPFGRAAWDGRALTLALPELDGALVARPAGEGSLAGTYTRVTSAGAIEVPFAATRRTPAVPRRVAGGARLAGEWGLTMGDGATSSRLLGVFREDGGRVEGTLLATSGDYGPMHGTFDGRTLVLSVFNGVFVYRLDAEVTPDGGFAGQFRSRASPPVAVSGRRLDAAAASEWLPDGASVVRAKDPAAPYVFSFPDEAGRTVASTSEELAGKPLVVTIMGSWCPNCHDEAPVLEDLFRRYRSAGLRVVALAFEYTDDAARNARLARSFRDRHRVTYPILLAGTTKGLAASGAVAPLTAFKGYPTTLFLDRGHRIVKVHTGFDGPSTGVRFEALKRRTEAAVRELLR